MGIPNWVRTALKESIEKTSVEFSDATGTLDQLLDLYARGQLDEKSAAAVEEIKTLLNLVENATEKLGKTVGGLSKIAKDEPISFGDKNVDNLLKESPPMVPSPAETAAPALAPGKDKAPSKGKLPAKIKQPETTKWKEIRFNKRTGTWQVIVTIRHSRNFLTENDAVDFTKKASVNGTEKV